MSVKLKSKKFELTYKGFSAVLLGNGINNLNSEFRWENLLKKVESSINLSEKSYPLAFEEIVFNKLMQNQRDTYDANLKIIKDEIAQYCRTIKPVSQLKRMVKKNVSVFLTTNYDYAIELALNSEYKKRKKSLEPKYSLFRKENILRKEIWHIHGEIDNGYMGEKSNYSSASIMIGHEHYGDYYRRIHQYLRPFSTDDKTKLNYSSNRSWVNLFFTHNIHIVGFSLDMSEFHIWWLLAYRAGLKKKYKKFSNKIIFHCASYDLDSAQGQAKKELLESLGVRVKIIEITEKTEVKYPLYWNKFLKSFHL